MDTQKFLTLLEGSFITENMEEVLQIDISLDDLKLKRRQMNFFKIEMILLFCNPNPILNPNFLNGYFFRIIIHFCLFFVLS